jgi:hypothetical protein
LFKKIKYQFVDDHYNEPHIATEAIKEIIVKATPSSSCWWSKLKHRTDNAKDRLDKIKKNQESILAGLEKSTGGPTGKTCSGILNLFAKTYLIKSPTDVVLTIDSKSNIRYDVATPDLLQFEFHKKEQFWSEDNTLFENKACVKFKIQVRVSATGFGYILTAPLYHNELDATFALGYVAPEYAIAEELNFFMIIDVPKKGTKTITIKKGTVLQYLIPDVKTRLVHEKRRFLELLLDTAYSKKRT